MMTKPFHWTDLPHKAHRYSRWYIRGIQKVRYIILHYIMVAVWQMDIIFKCWVQTNVFIQFNFFLNFRDSHYILLMFFKAVNKKT